MKTTYSALAIVVVSMTFTAAASGGQDKIPELQRDGASVKDSVTLTGCVTRGTEPGTFTLTNVPKAGDGAEKDVTRPQTVVLSATDVDISKHVDHMVSVTGLHAFEVAPIGTTGSEKPATPDARKEGDKKAPPTFTITSLKMVAASCAKPTL